MRIFIDGQEGTTGLQLRQRLEAVGGHELLILHDDERKNPEARRKAVNSADIVFLCLPDGAARESVSMVENENVVVIDASTAHRTAPGWAYGFPELSPAHAQAVRSGKRVAVPGCYATGFLALAYPLVAANILPKNAALTCFAISGYTGGGKSMIAQYEQNRVPGDVYRAPRPYALSLQHKHLKEMTAVAGLSAAPAFLPSVGDFPRGMLVTVPVFSHIFSRMFSRKILPEALTELYDAHYAGQERIRVLPTGEGGENGVLDPTALAGQDGLEIMVFGGEERVLLAARLDNLGKGAAGAAMQLFQMKTGGTI